MKVLFGTHHFEHGVKPCLMVLGKVFYTAICIESEGIKTYMVPVPDKARFFKELGNSEENLKGIKRIVRQMQHSSVTGKKRDATKKAKKLFARILELEDVT